MFDEQRKERLYDALNEYFDYDETQTLLKDIQAFIAEEIKHHQSKLLNLTDFSDSFK